MLGKRIQAVDPWCHIVAALVCGLQTHNLLGDDFVNELAVHDTCVPFCDLWGRNIDNVKMLRVTNVTGLKVQPLGSYR